MRYRVYIQVGQANPVRGRVVYGEWVIVEASSEDEARDKARDKLIQRIKVASVLELS